jgi:hypothetical protein
MADDACAALDSGQAVVVGEQLHLWRWAGRPDLSAQPEASAAMLAAVPALTLEERRADRRAVD